MASELRSEMRIISAQESVEIYGFTIGKTIKITGMNLTAEKVALIMNELTKTLVVQSTRPTEALASFNKFKAFCKVHQADLTFS